MKSPASIQSSLYVGLFRDCFEDVKRDIGWISRCFPDGNSALMLVCARLRHVAGTQWGNKKYMSMKHLEALLDDASVTA